MNKQSWLIIVGLPLLVAVAAYFYFERTQIAPPLPTVSDFGATPSHTAALSLCTGIEVNDGTIAIAYANCLGKVRGFVDSHNILVALAQASSQTNEDLQLWCIPPNVNDKQLLDAMFSWVESNQARFIELAEMYGASDATASVIISAMHAAYPCKRSPT